MGELAKSIGRMKHHQDAANAKAKCLEIYQMGERSQLLTKYAHENYYKDVALDTLAQLTVEQEKELEQAKLTIEAHEKLLGRQLSSEDLEKIYTTQHQSLPFYEESEFAKRALKKAERILIKTNPIVSK